MTKEELLKPRWKAIADFPFNTYYKVGGIITDGDNSKFPRNENGRPVYICDWEKFPHIFKKLEWWEERKPEDMPKYVYRESHSRYHKVKFWGHDNKFPYDEETGFMICNTMFLAPASEEQYLKQQEFLTQQKFNQPEGK